MQQRLQTSVGLHAGSHCQHLGTSVPSLTSRGPEALRAVALRYTSRREVHGGLALLVPDPQLTSSRLVSSLPAGEKHASCSANYEGHSQAETTHFQVLYYASRLRSTFLPLF